MQLSFMQKHASLRANKSIVLHIRKLPSKNRVYIARIKLCNIITPEQKSIYLHLAGNL